MIKGNKSILISLISLFLFSACQNYFGNETDISFIEKPEFQPREVAYVPVQPAWNKFQSPSDIHAGFDELLYVVDRAQSRVYCLDESGRILGNIEIPNVKKVIQDRKFDLLALGTKPATINGVTYDLACIYLSMFRVFDNPSNQQLADGRFSVRQAALLHHQHRGQTLICEEGKQLKPVHL